MGQRKSRKGEDPDPAEPRGYNEIADHILAARQIAKTHAESFLVHLLDMALVELARRGAVRMQ